MRTSKINYQLQILKKLQKPVKQHSNKCNEVKLYPK